MDDQTNLTREHLETSKQRARVYREWVYLIIACIVALTAVWALWSWKKGNDMAGALNARAIGILDKLDAKINAVDLTKLTDVADSTKARIEALAETQNELNRLIASTNRNTTKLSDAATARINQAGENLTSLKNVTDESKAQLKNIGDSATTAINKIPELENALTKTVNDADTQLVARSNQFGESITAINAKINDERVNQFIDSLPKIGKNIEQITSELGAMTGNFKTASEKAPEIADLWARMMRTSAKFQKALIIARIIGLVEPLFQPLVGGIP